MVLMLTVSTINNEGLTYRQKKKKKNGRGGYTVHSLHRKTSEEVMDLTPELPVILKNVKTLSRTTPVRFYGQTAPRGGNKT